MKLLFGTKEGYSSVTWWVWWIFMSCSIVALIFTPIITSNWNMTVSITLAFLSVALGSLAISMSLNSDLRMEALTNSSINEKLAIISEHALNIIDQSMPNTARMWWDITACLEMWKWMTKSQRKAIQGSVSIMIDIINKKPKGDSSRNVLDEFSSKLKKLKHLNIK